MSVTVTLASLRQDIGINLGEGRCNGTVTGLNGPNPVDSAATEQQDYWDGGWFQDLTQGGFPISRITSWDQGSNTYFLAQGITIVANDLYEVHKKLSPAEFRVAINRGIATCGEYLRNYIRDETNTIQGNIYQITPNYLIASPNAFFARGVQKVEVQVDTGSPTDRYVEVPAGTADGWTYLDDRTIQLPRWVPDTYSGLLIRLSGYGPVTGLLTTDTPTTVVATLDDDFLSAMLVWASTRHAWLILAAKKTSNESSQEKEMADAAGILFKEAKDAYAPVAQQDRSFIVPVSSGWSGGGYWR